MSSVCDAFVWPGQVMPLVHQADVSNIWAVHCSVEANLEDPSMWGPSTFSTVPPLVEGHRTATRCHLCCRSGMCSESCSHCCCRRAAGSPSPGWVAAVHSADCLASAFLVARHIKLCLDMALAANAGKRAALAANCGCMTPKSCHDLRVGQLEGEIANRFPCIYSITGWSFVSNVQVFYAPLQAHVGLFRQGATLTLV